MSSWFQRNLNNPTFRSFVVALAAMSSVIIVNHPALTRRFPVLQRSLIMRIIVMFLLIFSSQAALDMAIKFKDKTCEIIDSMSIGVAALLGFGIFFGLTRLPATRFRMMNLENRSPILYLMIMASITGVVVFFWKRFGRVISRRKECNPC